MIKRLPLAALIVFIAATFALALGQSLGNRHAAPPAPHAFASGEPPAVQGSTGTKEQATNQSSAVAASALDIVPGESAARYRVREQLVNLSVPIDAVGETRGVSGQVAFDEDGELLPGASWITVDLASLRSDQARRDNFVSRNTLETDRHPHAQFVPAKIEGLPHPLPQSGEATIKILGDLTIRGVTRPVEWVGAARFQPDGMRVEAETVLTFEQFEIAKPRVALVLSVEDEIRLEADIFFAKNHEAAGLPLPSRQMTGA